MNRFDRVRQSAIAILLLSSALAAQDSRNMILAASQTGVVELIDPSTLNTVARIHFNLPLNGISAGADGSSLFVEGPIPGQPQGCCALYQVDLGTLQVTVAASVPGSRSRAGFVASGSVVYPAAALTPNSIPREMNNEGLHLSPGNRWLFGVRSFRGPALDVYDLALGQLVRQLTPDGLEGNWWPAGTWSGDRFYLYAANDQGFGRIWSVSPETSQLSAGVPVAPVGRVAGCSDQSSKALASTAGKLFLYEQFGFKADRRDRCPGVPGGAWMVDPATGQLTRQIAPDLYFSALLAGPAGSGLYGLSAGSANWQSLTQLVRIDPASGSVLQSRPLDPGFWRVALAPLRTVPTGDIHVTLAR
jgi:hypothetical protein